MGRRPPRLLLITPPDFSPPRLMKLLPQLHPLVDAIQLRFPQMQARPLFELACTLALVSPRPALLINDRLDIAWSAGLDGVHLRDRGIPVSKARVRSWMVGVSRHDARGLGASEGADYALLSPVFPTPSKPDHKGLGLDKARELIRRSPCPVLALGGVTPELTSATIAAGFAGVAVMSAVLAASDPVAAAAEYASALG